MGSFAAAFIHHSTGLSSVGLTNTLCLPTQHPQTFSGPSRRLSLRAPVVLAFSTRVPVPAFGRVGAWAEGGWPFRRALNVFQTRAVQSFLRQAEFNDDVLYQ